MARTARGGTLIAGGGFAGAYVARYLGKAGATIVSPENFMLFTPLLPEAASGTLEPRHVVVPLRLMCPHSEFLLGSVTGLDAAERTVAVDSADGPFEVGYDHLVLALGSIARTLPIPGLAEHGLGFKDLADAIALRNHVLGQLEAAAMAGEDSAARHLTFVFVGAGYAGVEALAELSDLVSDAMRHYPELRGRPRRWVLVDAAPKILPEIPSRLGDYAAEQLTKRGIEIHVGTTLESVDAEAAILSNGTRIPTATLVWTAGVRANPLLAGLGLPLDERRRVKRRRDPPRRGPRQRLGARRLRARAQPGLAGAARPADLAARPPPGASPGKEPPRRAAAVPLSHARPGRDPRPLQGHRRRARPAPDRLSRLVRDEDVPPLPAAAVLPEAARGRRLDGGALLPARHRRARDARPPAGARR